MVRVEDDSGSVAFLLIEVVLALVALLFIYAIFSYGADLLLDKVYGMLGNGLVMSTATHQYFDGWEMRWDNVPLLAWIAIIVGGIIMAIAIRAGRNT
ncbi:hypothetical protein [Methanocella sp. MCL-LM]|uniref:hypothetical protein n=1 Tax=Methanocella sp. MCL-LM TaxID=3412035 RepID=UPI003C7782B1